MVTIEKVATVPTRSVEVAGTAFFYRRLGPRSGVPVVFLHHLAGVLDDWDPLVVDALAADFDVITFDNRGVGRTRGTVPTTIEGMAEDAIAFITALGLEQVDLLGFSMGGMIAQVIVEKRPDFVRALVLAGTGPAGGRGIEDVAKLSHKETVRGLLTFRDPKQRLFFTRSVSGKAAAKAYAERIKGRRADKDKSIALGAYLRQLTAIKAWGRQAPTNLEHIRQPTLIANGDHDAMVPTENSHELHRRIPNASIVIYDDAGHGGVFEHHADFVVRVRELLRRTASGAALRSSPTGRSS